MSATARTRVPAARQLHVPDGGRRDAARGVAGGWSGPLPEPLGAHAPVRRRRPGPRSVGDHRPQERARTWSTGAGRTERESSTSTSCATPVGGWPCPRACRPTASVRDLRPGPTSEVHSPTASAPTPRSTRPPVSWSSSATTSRRRTSAGRSSARTARSPGRRRSTASSAVHDPRHRPHAALRRAGRRPPALRPRPGPVGRAGVGARAGHPGGPHPALRRPVRWFDATRSSCGTTPTPSRPTTGAVNPSSWTTSSGTHPPASRPGQPTRGAGVLCPRCSSTPPRARSGASSSPTTHVEFPLIDDRALTRRAPDHRSHRRQRQTLTAPGSRGHPGSGSTPTRG